MSDTNTETKQKNPHLFCLITGKSRPTTWAYLKDKAERLGTDADSLINNYVSREAITKLLDGKSVSDIRATYKEAPNTEISTERLAELIRLNSKAKKAADKFNSTTQTAEEQSVVANVDEQAVIATAEVNVGEQVTNVDEQAVIATAEVNVDEQPKKKSKKKAKAELDAAIHAEVNAEMTAEMTA